MADTHETIADIVRKMRNEIAELRKVSPNVPSIAADWWEARADEIEAAHKREAGDAAKLREALVSVQKKIHYLIGSLNVPNSLVANRMEINGIINAALAAPPRNCDRFATVKEATIAFARERQDAPHPCPDFTFSRWLLTPVKKEGGAK